jgi:hypothetical protein
VLSYRLARLHSLAGLAELTISPKSGTKNSTSTKFLPYWITPWSLQGAGIIIEGWPYTASCQAWPGDNGPKGVICTAMDGPYRLPCHELLSCEMLTFPAAVIYCSKYTELTVKNEITHGRQGRALPGSLHLLPLLFLTPS